MNLKKVILAISLALFLLGFAIPKEFFKNPDMHSITQGSILLIAAVAAVINHLKLMIAAKPPKDFEARQYRACQMLGWVFLALISLFIALGLLRLEASAVSALSTAACLACYAQLIFAGVRFIEEQNS